MPLGRYFIFVGSVLLTLLFVAASYMPQLPLEPARADIDRGIRVQSRHRWPEKIVIDTSLPTIVPASAVAADLPAAAPQPGSPRGAFALAAPEAPQARPPSSSSGRKPVQKRRAKTPHGGADRVARHAPDGFRIALPMEW